MHVRSARRGVKTRLAHAIRLDGESGFDFEVLEEGIADMQVLAERERFWAEHAGAFGEHGLNKAKAGGLGGPRGLAVVVGGDRFRSKKEASEVLGLRLGIAPSVILSRINQGRSLPAPASVRRHSKHPDAGTSMFRRWLALLKRYPNGVVKRWLESYDNFKSDIQPVPPQTELVRINKEYAWGPDNFKWVTKQHKIEMDHGVAVVIHGVSFPSMTAAASAHGMPVSTLKDRIRRQRLPLGVAIERPLGATSYRSNKGAIKVDGFDFRSKRQAILHIARTRGWSEDKAKYRFTIGDY